MKPVKLTLDLHNTVHYVRLVSGLFPGGLTRKEMQIIVLLMQLMLKENTNIITQPLKERARIVLGISSQTMHNHWNKFKKKGVIKGHYKDFELNKLFSFEVDLSVKFHAEI